MHNIYIGFDRRESVAFDVAARSILRRCDTAQFNVVPLMRSCLPMLKRRVEMRDGRMWCPISQAPMATEFAISRFCVPLIDQGVSLFLDSDIICRSDIMGLLDYYDSRYAVQVVKREHVPTEATKMDGQIQTSYPRKNWSSVILWNGAHPAHRRLFDDDLINTWPGRDLHAFKWLKDEEIGELPRVWNQLIGVDEFDERAGGILHYTSGGPWLPNWAGGPHDDLWLKEQEEQSHEC